MKARSRVLLGVSIGLLVLGLIGVGLLVKWQLTTFRIAVGPTDGEEAQMAQFLEQGFIQNSAQVRLVPVSTVNAADSLAAMRRNEVDLAIVRSNEGAAQAGGVVAILRKNAVLLFALTPPAAEKPPRGKTAKAEKIEKVADLQGRRIGIVGGNQAAPDLLAFVMRHYGLPPDKYQTRMVAVDDLRTVVNDGAVDALFVAAPLAHPALTAAVAAASRSKNEPTFLALQGEAIEALHPGYESMEISEGTFGGEPNRPGEDLSTVAFSHYLVARPGRWENSSLWENRTYELARALYGARFAIARDARGIVNIQAPSTDKDAKVPVHPGALAYLTDSHKSFFDRYGDQIFYGLLLLPFLGSALAGAMSFFRANIKKHRRRLTELLLQIIQRTHDAETPEALDHLQREVDKILRATFQLGSQELDEDTYAQFTLLLEQARLSITDRRAALAGMRPAPVRSIAPSRAEA